MPSRSSRANRTAFALAVMLVALIAGSGAARAGEAGASEKPQTSWYGWQTLLLDAGAIASVPLAYALDAATKDSTSADSYEVGVNLLFASGFAVYALGGPVIHWAHGHGLKGLGSLGLRVGLPIAGTIAGALIGAAACGSDEGEFGGCPLAVGAVGMLAGFVAAPIVDAAVLAREPVTQPTGPRLQAAFVPSGGGGRFVLTGRF